jgi:hypothetical protein
VLGLKHTKSTEKGGQKAQIMNDLLLKKSAKDILAQLRGR